VPADGDPPPVPELLRLAIRFLGTGSGARAR
jgi:hypothetical protein